MATFKVRLIGRWCEAEGWVEVEGEGNDDEEEAGGDDEVMSE